MKKIKRLTLTIPPKRGPMPQGVKINYAKQGPKIIKGGYNG